MVFIQPESDNLLEKDASFMDRMLKAGKNIRQVSNLETKTPYVLESVNPVQIGFLIRNIVQTDRPENPTASPGGWRGDSRLEFSSKC